MGLKLDVGCAEIEKGHQGKSCAGISCSSPPCSRHVFEFFMATSSGARSMANYKVSLFLLMDSREQENIFPI